MRQRFSRELSAMSASPAGSPFPGSFTLPSCCSSTLLKLPAPLRQCVAVVLEQQFSKRELTWCSLSWLAPETAGFG